MSRAHLRQVTSDRAAVDRPRQRKRVGSSRVLLCPARVDIAGSFQELPVAGGDLVTTAEKLLLSEPSLVACSVRKDL